VVFSRNNANIWHELATGQAEVSAYFIIHEKVLTLDVVHCISEFLLNFIGMPHPLPQMQETDWFCW
jgi:hypothetical protein